MSPLSAYESLLLSNTSTVGAVESAVSNITWLLPGRFHDAELASEGLYALLNVLTSYHDHLIAKNISSSLSLPPHPFESSASVVQPLLPPPSDHTRYTRFWMAKSTVYKNASRALNTIRFLELLVEMLARKKVGDRRRWKIVLLFESVKTFLKLTILLKTSRPVLHAPIPQREVDISSIPQEALKPFNSSVGRGKPKTPHLPAYTPLKSHLLQMAGNVPERYMQHPLQLLPELKGKTYLAEVLASCVGLIHALLLIRCSRYRSADRPYNSFSLPTLSRSLTPYLIPLSLSLLARHLRRSSELSSPSRQEAKETPLLLAHYAQQDRALAMRAFMTGPMWIGWTRPKVVGAAKLLEKIPVIGLVGELIEGYLPLVDDYFFCGCFVVLS
nr:peroxin-16 [Cryptococcus depauperatus CBS 7841]